MCIRSVFFTRFGVSFVWQQVWFDVAFRCWMILEMTSSSYHVPICSNHGGPRRLWGLACSLRCSSPPLGTIYFRILLTRGIAFNRWLLLNPSGFVALAPGEKGASSVLSCALFSRLQRKITSVLGVSTGRRQNGSVRNSAAVREDPSVGDCERCSSFMTVVPNERRIGVTTNLGSLLPAPYWAKPCNRQRLPCMAGCHSKGEGWGPSDGT